MKLADSPFQKGLYMKVPKGTPLFSRWHGALNEVTNRDVIVEISDVRLPNPNDMLTQGEKDERQKRYDELRAQFIAEREKLCVKVHHPAVTHNPGTPRAFTQQAFDSMEVTEENKPALDTLWHQNDQAEKAITAEYKALGESRFGQDEVLVSWSKDSKTAPAKYLALADKPEVRKKQPKVNIRQQMVPKSRWKVTEDKDIYYGAENPAFTQAIEAWHTANPRPGNTATNAAHDAWHNARNANQVNLEKTLGTYTPTLYATIKAGTIFEVTGKFLSYWRPFGWGGQHYGNICSALFDGAKNDIGLEYNQIKDIIEPVSIPTVKAFVLRHKSTGQFYASYEYSEKKTELVKEQAGADGAPADQVRWMRGWEANHANTFMKGKKWDNLGKAKTSILMMTGYYNGLPGATEALPEWSGGDATMTADDLREYELVEFDKLSRSEVGVVAEFQDWFERSWQLRELTMKYGSSVRQVYKALEKAKMLDQQKGVAVFTVVDEDALDLVGYWGNRTALTDEDKDEIKRALSSVKGKFKQAVDHKSAAVSFPDKGSAMMFKLAYNGNLKVSIIDLEDMKETIGE